VKKSRTWDRPRASSGSWCQGALADPVGGRIRANIRVQNARQEQAVIQYEKAILMAVEDVENALTSYTREQPRLESLRALSRGECPSARSRQRPIPAAWRTFFSVLDAQRALCAAEDALAQSETAAVVSLIAVYKALGGGWTLDATASESHASAWPGKGEVR
jgi:outer membrane protein, multidrug efflux system